jgi:hypothetical protein
MSTLAQHLDDIVRKAILHTAPAAALVVYDLRSPLALALYTGYRTALSKAIFLNFDEASAAGVLAALDLLPRDSLVVLVQSTRFDMGDFRFRLELFRRGMRVIEHPHLARPRDDVEAAIYMDALAYDPVYYRTLGASLKVRIDGAERICLRSSLGALDYAGPFESARLNVGDYTGMPNVGGQFPIGEVFTEPVALEAVNGVAALYAFGAEDFSVTFVEPAFALAEITAVEGQVWVRELGFGLNPAFSRSRRVHDVSAYERTCGVHLSLGAKHPVYPKAGFSKRHTRFHVDVFCETDAVTIDDTVVYAGERYCLPG